MNRVSPEFPGSGKDQQPAAHWFLRLLVWAVTPLNRATARRWVDILLLSITASIVYLLLLPALEQIARGAIWLQDATWQRLDATLGTVPIIGSWSIPLAINYSVLLVLSGLAMFLLSRLGCLRLSHAKTLLLYPPTMVAVIPPVAVLAWLQVRSGTVPADAVQVATVLLVIPAIPTLVYSGRSLLRLLWKRQRREERKFHSADQTLKKFAENPNRLIEWLKDDEPVETPADDLFDTTFSARRIAQIITDTQLGRIGLIGPWGSGKTTALNLVDFLLHRSPSFQDEYRRHWLASHQDASWRRRLSPPRILTCRASAWGFRSESVAGEVLRQVVAALSKHIDCLPIRSLPAKYLGAMKGVVPSWFHLPLTMLSTDNPVRQLQRLDPILEAINARVVVFIEDLDRNTEVPDVDLSQSVKNEGASTPSEIRNNLVVRPNRRVLLDIEALLDRLKEVKRVSFVLAISRG